MEISFSFRNLQFSSSSSSPPPLLPHRSNANNNGASNLHPTNLNRNHYHIFRKIPNSLLFRRPSPATNLLLHFSSSSSSSSSSSYSSSSSSSSFANDVPSSISIDFLIQTLGFSKSQADSFYKKFGYRKTHQKPDSVIHLFREFGFSETQIRKTVLLLPQILFADVDKTLKPKLSLFQNELGLTGSNLVLFIYNNPSILTYSLERRLVPNICLLKEFIPGIENNKDCKERGHIIQVQYSRCLGADPKTLLNNVTFLQSCGIVGDQLSTLFKLHSWLLTKSESAVKDLVLKAQEMGFSCDSRMLVHALQILSTSSSKTIESKFKLLRSFGFSQEECSAMFRSTPNLLGASEKRLTLGINFYDSAGFERKMLVRNPICLMYSLEKRVIPRFRVYQILKSKEHELFKNKCPGFPSFLTLTEEKFLEKYVFKFEDNAEELLAAYNNGNVLNSSKEGN